MLYPDSRFRMSEDTLDSYLRQLIEAHSRVEEVTIAWQGGEPTLMGLDFFRKSIEITRKYLKPGQRAQHTIQTNGTKLDAEWAQFFKENDFLVGISIDGPREIHDAYRVTRGGSGSFDQVIRGLDFLRAAKVGWNVLTRSTRRTPTAAVRSTAFCAMSWTRSSSSSFRSSNASPMPQTTALCRGRRGGIGRSTSRRATSLREGRSPARDTVAF